MTCVRILITTAPAETGTNVEVEVSNLEGAALSELSDVSQVPWARLIRIDLPVHDATFQGGEPPEFPEIVAAGGAATVGDATLTWGLGELRDEDPAGDLRGYVLLTEPTEGGADIIGCTAPPDEFAPYYRTCGTRGETGSIIFRFRTSGHWSSSDAGLQLWVDDQYGVSSCQVPGKKWVPQAGEYECIRLPLIQDQLITFEELDNKAFGDPDFAVSASAGSGLPVTFAAAGKCTISGSTVHLTGAGTCSITASQAGDANYHPAPEVSRTFNIAKGPATLALSALDHTYDATSTAVVVTTTPADLSGVALTYDGAPTPPTNAGSYAVEATLTHDDYEAKPATGTLTVLPATPNIAWTPVTPMFLGAALGSDQLNAQATGAAAAPLGGTFTYSPATGTVLPVGSQALTANFTPTDASNYTTATATVSVEVRYNTAVGHRFVWPVEQPANFQRSFRAGATIPVIFRLVQADGRTSVSTARATIAVEKLSNVATARVLDNFPSLRPDAGNEFTYSRLEHGIYRHFLGTRGFTTGTYRLTATLDDGSTIVGQVQIRAR